MLQINGLEQGLDIFKCLGSEIRMQIVDLLAHNHEMNLNEMAAALNVTNGALTPHIRKLEESGIIAVKTVNAGHGVQKVCSLETDQVLLNVYPSKEDGSMKMYETSIRVGHYSDYAVRPGCGLAGPQGLIGTEDEPRCFSWPERLEAEMVWLHDGYLEYRIPNFLPKNQEIVQLTLSFEVSGADQGSENDTQADLKFSLNGKPIGSWTTIRPQNHIRSIYTPHWWNRKERRHGYLKMLVINGRGVYLDGVKMEDTGPDWKFQDENGEMKLRFESRPLNGREGGLALYGSGFGNYKQDILARIHYMPEESIHG